MATDEMAVLTRDSALDLIECVFDVETLRELDIGHLWTYRLMGTCRWGHGVQTIELTRWEHEMTYPSCFPCPVTPKAGGACSDIATETIVETTAR